MNLESIEVLSRKKKNARTAAYITKDAYDDYVKEQIRYAPINKPLDLIDYDLYKQIINTFMSLMLVFITHGFMVHLPRFMGALRVIKRKRKFIKKNGKLNLAPDWNVSNKKKQEIIDAGGIPYEEWWELNGEKLEEFKEGATKKNNGGEKWLAFFTDDYYYQIDWYKRRYIIQNDELVRPKLWHLTCYKFSIIRDTRRELFKDIKNIPDYYFNHANIHNEILIGQCVQKFRDNRWKLDERCT